MDTDPVVEGLFAEFNQAFVMFMNGQDEELKALITDPNVYDACVVLLDIAASARTGYVAIRHQAMLRIPDIGAASFITDTELDTDLG